MRGLAALWLSVSLASTSPAPEDLARAEALLSRKDYAGAEALLREILRAEPRNARAHGNLALTLMPQGKSRVRDAVDEGRLAAAFAPESPEARYIYGLALRAAGRSADAAREFAKSSTLAPDAIGPLDALAEAYAATGDDRAVPAYERLIALQPGRSRYPLELAGYLWTTGQTERGNTVAAAGVERFPNDAPLRAAYGRALFEQQRDADAAAELARAVDLGVRDAGTLSVQASALVQAGRIDEARSALEAAVREHPDSAPLRLDLGRLYLSQGEGEPARRELDRAAALAPQDAAIRFQLGRAEEAVGRLDEAEASYRKAVELSPSLASPRYALGRLLVRRGRKEEGEKELAVYQSLYSRAARVQYEGSSRGAQIQLAESELARGDAAAALARFEALPEDAEILTGRARALSRLDRHPEAVRALERARDLQPDAPRIEALLAAERARVPKTP
ncbi:MAG TPA: tetratricopeptide repeat protein [Thermoanaerobaculia bacterium]